MHNCTINNNGFTLIELMIVVAIIGILAGISVPSLLHYIDDSKLSEARGNLRTIADNAVTYFNTEHYFDTNGTHKTDGRYPGCQDGDNVAPVDCGAAAAKTYTTLQPGLKMKIGDAEWSKPVWIRLGFRLDAPVYYGYEYTTADSTRTFTATATAKFDANKTSKFSISGSEKGALSMLKEVQ